MGDIHHPCGLDDDHQRHLTSENQPQPQQQPPAAPVAAATIDQGGNGGDHAARTSPTAKDYHTKNGEKATHHHPESQAQPLLIPSSYKWPPHFQILIRTSAVSCENDLQWITVGPTNVEVLWPLVAQFHALCATEFEHHEMEALSTWLSNLRDGGRLAPYIQTFSLLVRLKDHDPEALPEVLGGAARELYPCAECGLVSYIVVSEQLRGRRLAQRLMSRAVAEMTNLLAKPLSALFVDVLQVRDGDHGNFDAATRQSIWSKLGFLPLNYDMVYPGHMKGGRYQLAMFHENASSSSSSCPSTGAKPTSFSRERLVRFVSGLFYSILVVDHPETDRAAMAREVEEDVQQQLLSQGADDLTCIAVGSQYWR